MLIDKQREGRSDHISLSPELDQVWDPQLQYKDPDLKIVIDCFNNNTIKKGHFSFLIVKLSNIILGYKMN